MSVCNICCGLGRIASERMRYASYGAEVVLTHDLCNHCMGSGRLADYVRHDTASSGILDTVSVLISLVLALSICWAFSKSLLYTDLSDGWKLVSQIAVFLICTFLTQMVLTTSIARKVLGINFLLLFFLLILKLFA